MIITITAIITIIMDNVDVVAMVVVVAFGGVKGIIIRRSDVWVWVEEMNRWV